MVLQKLYGCVPQALRRRVQGRRTAYTGRNVCPLDPHCDALRARAAPRAPGAGDRKATSHELVWRRWAMLGVWKAPQCAHRVDYTGQDMRVR